jgi:hypothetical protein
LVALALPAGVAIWSGWVGLGQLSGFGVVHPLPGIADEFKLNSAITLPIGVEAYAAYALGTWLSPRSMPARARRFAAWSALSSLGIGLLGQVIYHLLTAAGWDKAPTSVVVFVACLPVLVLGAGATLHHLLGEDGRVTGSDATRIPRPARRDGGKRESDGAFTEQDRPDLVDPAPNPVAPVARPGWETTSRTAWAVDVTDLLDAGREVAAELVEAGKRVSRATLIEGLRARGLSCSTDRGAALAARLRAEMADHIGQLEVVS